MTPRFQPGGTLREGALYIERPADRELPEALLGGEFCYVLAPRQIGKSSLRVRTVARLRAAGVRCATVDLTRVGGRQSTEEQWYYGLLQEIASGLKLLEDPAALWQRHRGTTPVHRLALFLRREVLGAIDARVVIFIDEIDSTLALPFATDDFFAVVRETYNRRADDPAYTRLGFCLLGVATPGELVRDPARTPFNVGRPVALEDFTEAEAAGFLPGLAGLPGDPRPLLAGVLRWTEGHPYLSQRLCAALTQAAAAPRPADVDRLVHEIFVQRGREEDPSLEYAERRLLCDERARPMLALYRRLLQGLPVPSLRSDPMQLALALTGLAAERRDGDGRWLRVRNPLFAAVFGEAWIRGHETARLFSEPLARWLAAGRSDDLVLRGQALEEAQGWARGRQDLLAEESEFLLAGVSVARAEEALRRQAERDRERRRWAEAEVRAQRRNVAVLLGVVVLLGASLGAVLWLYGKAVRAEQAERRARRQAEVAIRAEQGARAAFLAGQPGREAEALQLGILAAGAALRSGEPLPPMAAEGLVAAVLAGRRSRALRGHGGAVMGAAFSPDGRRMVTASQDGTARLWSADGEPGPVLIGHQGWLWGAAFSPDGEEVVTASHDHTARRFRARDGRALATFNGHRDAVWSAAFSPDGRRVVTASLDGTGRVWDRDGRVLLQLSGHGDLVRAAAFSPDGQRLLTGGGDGAVRVWDGGSGALLRTLQAPSREPVTAAAFAPDSARIAVSTLSEDGVVWLFAVAGGPPRPLTGHRGRVWSIVFSPDGQRLVSAGDDQTARVWDTARGEAVHVLRGHTDQLRSAAFSPDGGRVVTASLDQTARLWDAGTGAALRALTGHASAVRQAVFSPDGATVLTASQDHTARLFGGPATEPPRYLAGHSEWVSGAIFSPDGRLVLTVSGDRTARIFDARTGQPAHVLRGHLGPVINPSFSPDGKRALTASVDGTARVWDVATGAELLALTRHTAWMRTAAFSADGRRIVTTSFDNTVRLWDAATGAEERVLQASGEQIGMAAFSPDGRLLLTAGAGAARLWAVDTGREIQILRGHAQGLTAALFSPDGRLVLTASGDGTARLWETEGGRPRAVLRGHGGAIRGAAFSPDGGRVATAGADRTARLWDAASGRQLHVLSGHRDGVQHATFSPDGRLVVTASDDHTARLWDAQEGRELMPLLGHGGRVFSAAFSPDGRQIVTASDDATVVLHGTRLEPIFAQACRLLGPAPEFAQVQPLCR